ncbi:hypothetical protein PybrP1_004871 [[Pythium] brassicae (nom. inval.)]|nr:hypothetical protein PybrP1_004871 [[Pythium] brassicae (nom. inval.)]
MKVTLNAPQPPATPAPKTASPPPRTRKSGATRALCRQTRAAVEGWLEKLLAPEKDKPLLLQHMAPRSSEGAIATKARRKELTRRASTGSLLVKPSDNNDGRARRALSLFSRRGGDKENTLGDNNNNNNNTGNDSASATTWLKPVPSFSELETTTKADEVARTTNTASRSVAADPATPESDCDSVGQHPERELFAYVMPPVEMPGHYRIQDRRGGMIVSGRAVLFTNSAFKRKLRNLSQLRAIPEHKPAQLQDSRLDAYLYGLQHYVSPPGSFASWEAEVEPLSHSI